MKRFLLVSTLFSTLLPSAKSGEPTAVRIAVTGTIELGLAPYIDRSLKDAARDGAQVVILDIDTPGGRIDAAERIVDAIRRSKVPVYAYVNPRAYSAGAMIALATKGIFIKSGGVIGAATPVDGQGTKASEKIVSAMRGEFRALAEAAGIDPRLAEAMVDESIDLPGIKPPGKLLTLSASEAVDLKVARARAESITEVLAAVGAPNATILDAHLNWAEQLARFFTNPIVSPLLLSLGVLGLIAGVKTGHFGLVFLLGLGSLGLFFGAGALVGLAGREEVILMMAGLVALAVEIMILPGFGVAGVLGILMIGAAVVFGLVGSQPTLGDFVRAGYVVVAAVAISIIGLVMLIRHLPNSKRFSRILLARGLAPEEGYIASAAREDLVGRIGTALTDLRPSGVASVANERIDVITEGDYIPAGATIRVVRSEGYRHVVQSILRDHHTLQPSES